MKKFEPTTITRFILFEILVLLLITTIVSVVSVIGLNGGDPKFDDRGNIELRIIVSSMSIVFTIGIISLVLRAAKQFPVNSKMALVFAL